MQADSNILPVCRWLFSQGYEVNLLDDGWQVQRVEPSDRGCSLWTPILQEVDESVLMAFVASKGYEGYPMSDIEVPDLTTWTLATYYDMLDLWGSTADARKRRVIGDIMLQGVAQLNDPVNTVFDRSEFLVQQTLSFVGTPLCECEAKLQLRAIIDGLHRNRTLSIQFEAVRALDRFIKQGNTLDAVKYGATLVLFALSEGCSAGYGNSEIQQLASSLLSSLLVTTWTAEQEADEIWKKSMGLT